MTPTSADEAFYADQIRLAVMRLNHHYGSTCPMPMIRWSLTGVTTLGRAAGHRLIKLNSQYARVLGREEYLQTVLHEACHIVTTWRRHHVFQLPHASTGPWAPHGAEWGKAMRLLGLRPDRTARISPEAHAQLKPGRTSTKVPVYCSCTTHWITAARAQRAISTGAVLRCKVCKSPCRIPGQRNLLTSR